MHFCSDKSSLFLLFFLRNGIKILKKKSSDKHDSKICLAQHWPTQCTDIQPKYCKKKKKGGNRFGGPDAVCQRWSMHWPATTKPRLSQLWHASLKCHVTMSFLLDLDHIQLTNHFPCQQSACSTNLTPDLAHTFMLCGSENNSTHSGLMNKPAKSKHIK